MEEREVAYRGGEVKRTGAYLKKRAARYRTPESVQRWKPGPSRSACQLADIGMRGLFIGSVKRQTFGWTLGVVQLSVCLSLSTSLSLSLSLSPLLCSPSLLLAMLRSTGAPPRLGAA